MKFKFLLIALALVLFSSCSVAGPGVAIVPGDVVLKVNLTDSNTTLNTNETNPSIVLPLDFDTETSLNRVPGYNAVVLASHNPDVDNSGEKEDIWEGGGLLEYLVFEETLTIVSTSSLDTTGGTGMRSLNVTCLNNDLVTVSETVILSGTNNVTTTIACLRPGIIRGSNVGSLGESQGIITATSSTSGILQMQMDTNEGISKNSHFTVPNNMTATIKQVFVGVTRTGGGQEPIVEIKGKVRFANNIWIQIFDFKIDTSKGYSLVLPYPISNELRPSTDFRLEVTTDKDNTDVLAGVWVVFSELLPEKRFPALPLQNPTYQ